MLEPKEAQQRFQELLPFYLNGTATEAERDWVAVYLTEHPEAAVWLRFDANLREILQSTKSPQPEEVRLQRFLTDFHQQLSPSPSWWRRASNLLLQPRLIPSPLLLLAALVIGIQGGLLMDRATNTQIEPAIYRSMSPGQQQTGLLRVMFKPEAPIAEISILLREQGAIIHSGPEIDGGYWIKPLPEVDPEALVVELRKSAWVESLAFDEEPKR